MSGYLLGIVAPRSKNHEVLELASIKHHKGPLGNFQGPNGDTLKKTFYYYCVYMKYVRMTVGMSMPCTCVEFREQFSL